jgi:hypothetical protein
MQENYTGKIVEYKDLGFMGYPWYRVGTDGSLWSSKNNKWGTGAWKRIKLYPSKWGHLSVCLSAGKGTRQKWFRVHRLVLLAFVGPCPEGMECCHAPDANPTNNNLCNLRWGTSSDNKQDKKLNGTYQWGEKNPAAKLNREIVEKIKMKRAEGLSYEKLAVLFGVWPMTIWNVIKGKQWAH